VGRVEPRYTVRGIENGHLNAWPFETLARAFNLIDMKMSAGELSQVTINNRPLSEWSHP